MARIAPWLSALLLIAAGLAIGLKGRLGKKTDTPVVRHEEPSGAPDEARVKDLLADRTRPWWQGHKLPMPPRTQLNYVAPDKMGSFNDPPVACPVMPLELARSLVKGHGIPDDHPLGGRPARLIDMRLRSLHLIEHIPDSLNVPYNRMAESLKSGDLAGLDLRTVVILYGDVYPHFDATAPFRVGKFEAYYCLEGGLAAWKAKGYPVVSNRGLAEYLNALNSEKVVGTSLAASDPADVGPAALKALLDLDTKPLVVFVGDEATFNAGRIPGAIRVTLDDLPARFEKEPTDRLIAVYCGCCEGSAKGLSGIAVEKLRQMKFTRLLHLSGHLKAWKDQGYALDAN
jgi:rhodanese-related sulfurtransferase